MLQESSGVIQYMHRRNELADVNQQQAVMQQQQDKEDANAKKNHL